MKKQLSPRDLEMLSAYLDGQLDSRGQVQLEKRLKAEPDLRAMHQDLERTRTLLRSAPPIKAPRSFKLTPQMVGEMPARVAPRRIYPVFQFASAFATLLLIVVLAGDFLGLARTGSPAAAPAPVAAVQMESTATQEIETLRNASPASGTAAADALQQKEMALPTEAVNPAGSAPMIESVPVTTTEITGSGVLSQTQTLSAEAYVSPEDTLSVPESEIAPGAIESTPPESASLPWLRILEGSLALLAIVLGVSALRIRRLER